MPDDHTSRRRRSFLKAITAAGTVGLAGRAGGDGGDGNGDGGGDAGNANGGNDTGNDSGGSGGEGAVEWTMGTSTPETATHASGVAMSQVVSEQSERISMSAQTTGGTAANPRLIANGDIGVAQSTAWAVARANTGGPPYGEPVEKR